MCLKVDETRLLLINGVRIEYTETFHAVILEIRQPGQLQM